MLFRARESHLTIFGLKHSKTAKLRTAKDHGKSLEVGWPPLLAVSSITAVADVTVVPLKNHLQSTRKSSVTKGTTTDH